MRLILGVVDVAYSGDKDAKTTGDVAQILEDKYHVMEIFYLENQEKIGEFLADGIAAQITALANGKKPSGNPFFSATQKIDERFRDFLDSGQMETILPITQPIAAAQIGVNHRKKKGYNKNHEARPAFIDTGLYQRSFRSEVEK